ncbi:MAG TPA: STY0301 family protein [Candidatus Angelobacter sp.]|nr:STY0301 family protein [Candidatus Angelobacter sp.]
MALSASGFAQNLYCPATISVNQQMEQVPAGWKASNENMPHRLAYITFYDGPPEQRASLTSDSANKSGTMETWRFQTNSEGTWIACSYASTDVVLAQSLPEGTSECSISYNARVFIDGHREIKSVSCGKNSAGKGAANRSASTARTKPKPSSTP